MFLALDTLQQVIYGLVDLSLHSYTPTEGVCVGGGVGVCVGGCECVCGCV